MTHTHSGRRGRGRAAGLPRHPDYCAICRKMYQRQQAAANLRRFEGATQHTTTAKETRRRLRVLLERGFSQKQIARTAGVASSSVERIMAGQQHAVSLRTEQRITDLLYSSRKLPGGQPPAIAASQRRGEVSSDRARRIIQGLMVRGYSLQFMANQLGVSKNCVWLWLSVSPGISIRNENRLLALASKFGDVEAAVPYAERNRAQARAKGYQNLATWDDLL